MSRVCLRSARALASAGSALAIAALATVGGASPADAAPRDDFALGQSARSGAVCKAVRDFDDPLAAQVGRRAWQVTCRGWTQTLGHIYYFQQRPEDGHAAWLKALGARADCAFDKALEVKAVAGAAMFACKSKPVGA